MKGWMQMKRGSHPTQKQIEDKLEQTAETAEKVVNIIRLSDAQKQRAADSHPAKAEASELIPQNELRNPVHTGTGQPAGNSAATGLWCMPLLRTGPKCNRVLFRRCRK